MAYFSAVDQSSLSEQPPVAFDQDLGLMLYDVFDLSKKNGCDAPPFITLFQAWIRGGVLVVPEFEDPQVLKPVAAAEG